MDTKKAEKAIRKTKKNANVFKVYVFDFDDSIGGHVVSVIANDEFEGVGRAFALLGMKWKPGMSVSLPVSHGKVFLCTVSVDERALPKPGSTNSQVQNPASPEVENVPRETFSGLSMCYNCGENVPHSDMGVKTIKDEAGNVSQIRLCSKCYVPF